MFRSDSTEPRSVDQARVSVGRLGGAFGGFHLDRHRSFALSRELRKREEMCSDGNERSLSSTPRGTRRMRSAVMGVGHRSRGGSLATPSGISGEVAPHPLPVSLEVRLHAMVSPSGPR